jgi:hypothetical protein
MGALAFLKHFLEFGFRFCSLHSRGYVEIIGENFPCIFYERTGARFALIQSASTASDTLPSAKRGIVTTHDGSSAINSYPFRMRNSSVTVNAVRLLPSMKE